MSRAIFLDRDGVINRKAESDDYVKSWNEFVFLPRAVEALALLGRTDYLLFVVTNQRGIARGLMSEGDLCDIHDNMSRQLQQAGARIDSIFHCPHEKAERCGCRKPEPGMLLEASRQFDVDLKESCIVGDSLSDIEAGVNAGCKELILVGNSLEQEIDTIEAQYSCFADLYEAASYICKKKS
ncbi:MAG: D-glycero-beta-D-manno-heptose 1,7-bisphosphate 7-phosphatase [Proteobacteria bacterium]|nr:D-glycero-beta-D-manno-heptose 1,7-bisphosphate 7-phosphatase [Pseudomonadota bacterium]